MKGRRRNGACGGMWSGRRSGSSPHDPALPFRALVARWRYDGSLSGETDSALGNGAGVLWYGSLGDRASWAVSECRRWQRADLV